MQEIPEFQVVSRYCVVYGCLRALGRGADSGSRKCAAVQFITEVHRDCDHAFVGVFREEAAEMRQVQLQTVAQVVMCGYRSGVGVQFITLVVVPVVMHSSA